MTASSTSWVAVYASIVATAALLLNFRTWYEKGVRLKLSLMPDAEMFGGYGQEPEKGLMVLTVVNRGGQPTTITHMVVLRFDNWWKRIRVCSSASLIIANPQVGASGAIPYELNSGKKWTGIARRRPDVIDHVDDGTYFIGVYASNRDRPYLIRVPKPKSKLPQDAKVVS